MLIAAEPSSRDTHVLILFHSASANYYTSYSNADACMYVRRISSNFFKYMAIIQTTQIDYILLLHVPHHATSREVSIYADSHTHQYAVANVDVYPHAFLLVANIELCGLHPAREETSSRRRSWHPRHLHHPAPCSQEQGQAQKQEA